MKWISRRVILAAAKLALIYCALLLIVFALVFTLFVPGLRFSIAEFAPVLMTLAIPFGIAFLLLAIARRAGFIALWAILFVYWGFLVRDSLGIPYAIPPVFTLWSIFALPLWIIGHVGVRDPSSRNLAIGRLALSPAAIVLACWLLLLAGSRFFFGPFNTDTLIVGPTHWSNLALWTLWAPAPFWISAFAVRHVWRGTAVPAVAESVNRI